MDVLNILNVCTYTFYFLAFFIFFYYMVPKLLVIAKRDLAKAQGDEQKFIELSKITQKNANDICHKTRAIAKSPIKIINKISKIHSDAFPRQIIQAGVLGKEVVRNHKNTQRQKKSGKAGRGGTKKTADSGDDCGDGEPPRNNNNPLQLLNWTGLAVLFSANEKTLRNQYYLTPWAFPEPIYIPGCRGPRWTPAAIQKWLDNQTYEPKKTKPTQLKNVSRGRPRLALKLGLIEGGAK